MTKFKLFNTVVFLEFFLSFFQIRSFSGWKCESSKILKMTHRNCHQGSEWLAFSKHWSSENICFSEKLSLKKNGQNLSRMWLITWNIDGLDKEMLTPSLSCKFSFFYKIVSLIFNPESQTPKYAANNQPIWCHFHARSGWRIVGHYSCSVWRSQLLYTWLRNN